MAEDSEAILNKIGVNRALPTVNAVKEGHSSGKIEEFYSSFDKDLMEKLYKIYEMDFILFGYSPDEYFKVVRNTSV